jgi:Acetyltransferase (GNAT) domain
MFLLNEMPVLSEIGVPPGPTMSVLHSRTQVGGMEIIEGISDDARQLCQEISLGEPVYELDWSEAYLQAFSPKGKLVLISVWRDAKLRAYLTLILKTSFVCGLPVRKLTSCANIHSCRFDLICGHGEERDEILRAMWRELKQFRRWDVLELTFVQEGSGIDELLQIAEDDDYSVARKFAWRALHLANHDYADEPDRWLAGTSRKFRANLRRTRNQLETLGTISFKHKSTADREELERFFQLEASGWKGRAGTAIACQPETRLFYELISTAATRNGYFSLDFLELNGTAISAHFALNRDGRYMLLKAAYDEEYRHYGPGHLIVWELLKHLGPLGLRELDFVGPATWDEGCWASEYRNQFTWLVFPKTVYGAIVHFVRITGREVIKSLLRRTSYQNQSDNSN